MRLELQTVLDGHVFAYILALDLPGRFKELRVLEEALTVDGEPLYARELAKDYPGLVVENWALSS